MSSTQKKPRLIYFRAAYDERLPKFLVNQADEHLRCLRYSFDVTLITEDGDYKKYCDIFEPDLALFETGVPLQLCRRPTITNVRHSTEVPKIGFLNADGFGEGRSGFLSDMHQFDFEAVFAVATTASEYLPGILDKIFYWPNFVDPEIYRDYGQDKCIPILITGSTSSLYPWRQRVSSRVSKLYPTMICPHPGYSGKQTGTTFLVGEAYARLINSARFAATCGTVAREVVRKHFEIPACNSCLVTEKSDGLLAAGFVDMVNCVFTEPEEIQDRLRYLFTNCDVLDRITNAGCKLVSDRHTIDQRRQILEWYQLRSKLKCGEAIIQENPFAPMSVSSVASRPAPYFANGLLANLLERGDRELFGGHPGKAEVSYAACTNYYDLMPEPRLKLALCKLRQGQVDKALIIINKPIEFTIARYGAFDPDPVEWAYLIATLLCQGKMRAAVKRSRQFSELHHLELDRMRSVVNFLASDGRAMLDEPVPAAEERTSVHRMPIFTFEDWVHQLAAMLAACGQTKFSKMLSSAPKQAAAFEQTSKATYATVHENRAANRYFAKAKQREAFKMVVRQKAKKILHGLERRVGYFLPYSISLKRKEEAFIVAENAIHTSRLRSLLAVGESCADVAFCGVDHSVEECLLIYVRFEKNSSIRNRQWQEKNWTYVEISARNKKIFRAELDSVISMMNKKYNQDFIDGIILDSDLLLSAGLNYREIDDFLIGFRLIIFLHKDEFIDSEVLSGIRNSDDYAMRDFSISSGQNCSVFERC